MYSLLKFGVWLVRAVVFIALLGLAIKNSGSMDLRFFFDRSWQVPISVVVLASFAAGVLVGLGALAGRRLRRNSSTSSDSSDNS